MTGGRPVAAVAAGAAVLLALPAGGRAFAAAVLLWGAVTLLELTALLAAVAHRPLVPAAALGLAMPIGVLTVGEPAWDRLPLLLALMLLAGFVLALVTPRKRQITSVLAATMLSGLAVGLGTAGVLVLRSAGAGFRWTVGVVAATALPVLLAAAARRFGAGAADGAVRVVTGGAVGGALLFALNPPFGIVTTPLLVIGGVAAGWAAAALVAMPGHAGGRPAQQAVALSALTAPLLAAPAAAFLALATQA